VENRYLGSDTNVKRIVDASTQATAVQAQVSQQNQRASSGVVDTILQGQAQLQQIEMNRLQSEIARASKPTGLQGLVQTAGEVFTTERKREADAAMQQQKLSQQQLEEERDVAFTMASDEVADVQRAAINNLWNEGTTNFKNRAAKVIAKYPNLTPKQIRELMNKVNDVAVARDQETRKSVEEETERQSNALADGEIQKFLTTTMLTPIMRLGKLLPTEQSSDYIEKYITPRFQEFLKRNKNFTLDQRLRAERLLLEKMEPAISQKSEAYANYEARSKAFVKWQEGNNRIQAALATGQIDIAEAKSRTAALEFETGYNMKEYMGSVGEEEERKLKFARTLNDIAQAGEIAEDRAIANFGFTTNAVNTMVAGALENPDNLIALTQDPLLRKSGITKEVTRIVNRIKEAQTELANEGIADAAAVEQLSNLDLANTNNFVQLTRSLSQKMVNNQALSAKDVLLKQTLEIMAERLGMGNLITDIGNSSGALSKQQLSELQKGLDTQRQGIAQVKAAVVAQVEARRNAFNVKYEDVLRQWGSAIKNPAEFRSIYDAGEQELKLEMDRLAQTAIQAKQNIQQNPTYGRQPNFNDVGGLFTGSVQRNSTTGEETYTIAPKTALQVQKHTAGDFITPIAAGVNAKHSFSMGSKGGPLGGGYGAWRNRRGGWSKAHAGIDFPLNGGQKAVSVVSGKVLAVANWDGYGGTVDVLGDNGYVYRFAHQQPFVKQGQRIQAGDAISTPNGSGVGSHHLHFEVRPYAEYKKNKFGMGGTIDPITHLRELTQKAGTSHGSSRKDLRGQPTQKIADKLPAFKAPNGSIFTPSAGLISGGLFQQVGKPTQQANQVFGAQRPMTNTGGLQSFRAGQPSYDYNSNYGYSYLSQNTELRKAFVDAAKELRVPATWIIDIAAQESGTFKYATKIHNPNSKTQNYGLFGFGKDSGVKNYKSLNPVQQVQAYVSYMKQNGWMKHLERVGGNADLAQLWAMTRMGWNWRQDILNGRKDTSLRLNDSGKTYADELRMLGRDVGREYDIPGGSRSGRSKRNSAVRSNIHSNLQQHLQASGTDILAREA
jgi:murein DD-endopeptidase MepM/ murein hydrolase activator NlpD